MRRQHTQVLAAPPDLVWAVAADTNRFDQSLGLNPATYRYEIGPDGVRARFGFSRLFGLPMQWIETGEWVEGRSLWGERRFLRPVPTRTGYRVDVAAHPTGTTISVEAYSIGQSLVARIIAAYWNLRFRGALRRFVAAIEHTLGRLTSNAGDRGPAAARAARLLLAQPPDRQLTGAKGRTDESALEALAARFAELCSDGPLRGRIVDFLREQPDDHVRLIRAFELAAAWRLERRLVLAGFLAATRAGLTVLVWQLNCPTCRIGAAFAGRLADVGRRVHCEECDIDFDVDFAANVEALFTVAAAIRRTEPRLYCGGSPWFRPHVFASFVLPPGATRDFPGPFPDGPLLVRALGGGRHLELDAGQRGGALLIDDDAVTFSTGEPGFSLENRGATETTVLFERGGWTADIVLGSVLVTMPDAAGIFGPEAPAVGRELRVGSLAVLFADVVASTELYESHGDARAYAALQQHAATVAAVVARHGGAVVKTLGDGIMACFPRLDAALAAGFDLPAATAALAARVAMPELQVRVGVHQGPCFLVGANDRLDLFGTTVNVAARLEAEAGAGQVATLSEHLDDDGVRRLVAEKRPSLRQTQSHLRGLRGSYTVAIFDIP